MRYVAICLALMAPGTAQAQDWWQGIWSYDPAWCAVAGQIGEASPAPIAISETEFLGYELSCAIDEARVLDGVGAAHLRMTCQSEGETYADERLVMRVDQGAKSVWIWFGADEPLLFQRCE